MRDAYQHDVLGVPVRQPRPVVEMPVRRGLVVEERSSGFTGSVEALEKGFVLLRDRRGRERHFRLVARGFAIDGEIVTLVAPPSSAGTQARARTASGSLASIRAAAQIARASRIFVEGIHDAALVERVWGEDLRELGVPVEYLEGIDDLSAVIADFRPGPGRRLGVLVDHLVPGSKETRIVQDALRRTAGHVLITGHPYVDIWQGVRPRALGIEAWPDVPRGQPWKAGICAALGFDDPVEMWRRILASVATYADLETPLIGAVERLIDFVAAEG